MSNNPSIHDRISRVEAAYAKLQQHLDIEEQKSAPVEQVPWARWKTANLFIRPKAGGLQRFEPRRPQRVLTAAKIKCFREKKPVRFVVLKSRQLGISTNEEADLFFLTHRYPERAAMVVAHRKDSAQSIFGMIRRYHENLPDEQRLPLEGGRVFKNQMTFSPPHNSSITVQTAGGGEIARGMTLNFVHVSELAFWEDAETSMTALLQAVPKETESWFTSIVVESTANGINLFKDYWDWTKDEDSVWRGFFFSWRDDPECVLPTPDKFDMTAEEKEFAAEYELSDGQILWARRVRMDQCNQSWEKFHQEYPVAEELAFAYSGVSVFSQRIVREQLEIAQSAIPAFRGDVGALSATEPVPSLGENETGPLTIYRKPDPKKTYVMGADPGEGIGAAYSEAYVLQLDPLEFVAQFRTNRIHASLFAVKLWLIGAHYYFPLLGVERNSVGMTVLSVLEGTTVVHDYPQIKRYPNLYYDTTFDQKLMKETKRMGFSTSSKTKEMIINRLSELVNQFKPRLNFVSLCLQMAGFVQEMNSRKFKQRHKDIATGQPADDGIMSAAITNQMRYHLDRPRFFSKPTRGDW